MKFAICLASWFADLKHSTSSHHLLCVRIKMLEKGVPEIFCQAIIKISYTMHQMSWVANHEKGIQLQ